MSETTSDAYKQRIEHAARALLLDEQICAVASQRMTLKIALLKVGFSQGDIDNNNKHRHAVDRAKRRLSQASLPSLVDIASPGAFSAITDTDTTTATTTTTTVTTATTKKKKRKRRKSKTRRTVTQVNSDDYEAAKRKKKEEESYFEAVKEWKTQSSLPKKQRISCRNIVNDINKKNDTNVNEATVRRRVKAGTEAVPPCRGRKGVVNGELRDALLSALRSYIALANANRTTMPNKQKIIKILDKVIARQLGIKETRKFAQRLMRDIALDVNVTTTNTKMEKRRLVWSTYNNINTWFEKMKEELIVLGFARLPTAEEDVEGELVFFDGQLQRILNIDESEVTTDGTSKLTGGRPITEYCSTDTRIGTGAEGTNKSGYAATFIGGSTMDGYPVPPHFQVRSLARTEQTKKLDTRLFENMRKVRGRWGFDEVTERGVTANCNMKAGMDVEEFCKYVEDCIVPLYPDAADKPGKRVLLIVDSGPGRIQVEMLARLKLKGIYVKPGVPNTTHITQPTDQNYGMFKSIYRSNLKVLTQHTTSIKHTSIPLLVFGGDYINEGVVLCHLESAFDEAFSFDRNQEVWKKLGFYPFTRACLLDAKVKHEVVLRPDGSIDLDADPQSTILIEIEKENKEAVAKINQLGGDGKHLSIDAPKLSAHRKKIAVTVPNTRERQDAIGRASTAGGQFFANAGGVINSDDFFIATERKKRSADIILLEKQKKEYDNYIALAAKAKQLIELKRDKGIDVYTHESLIDKKNITSEQLKLLIEDHTGKKPGAKDSTKDRLVALWLDVREKKAHETKEWTIVDDGRLHELRDEEITIEKTALGRAAVKQLQGFASMAQLLPQSVVDNLLPEEHKKALLSKLCPAEVKGPIEEV